MSRHVLVPVDESAHATAALTYALTEFPDAQITAFHVIGPSDFSVSAMEGNGVANDELLREHRENRIESVFEDAREQAASHGRDIETDTVVGNPPRSIVSYADEHAIDHIVIGSHGRTGASRVLLGSVAETVVRRASVPVTVVR